MEILAIETSCDETAISVISAKGGFKNPVFKILSSAVASQVKIHARFGGVVPNLAKREHQRNLVPILKTALKESGWLKSKVKNQKSKLSRFHQGLSTRSGKFKIQNLKKILEREEILCEKLLKFLEKYQKPEVDIIAVTIGPGLEPALWVGINFAKALAYFWNKPIIEINHLEGHIFSVFLKKNREKNFEFRILNFEFPAVALLVSGGHTQLVLMKNWLKYKIIGETLDDAAGEAFDKVARLLGLGYPGGPAIAAEAAKFSIFNFQFSNKPKVKIRLPRPMINSKDYNFSFSGLKTAVLYLLRDLETENINAKEIVPAIAYEFENAAIEVLIKKTLRAAKEYKVKGVIVAGGVAANKKLRLELGKALFSDPTAKLKYMMPEPEFTGDNAAMIAAAAGLHGIKKEFAYSRTLKAKADWKLDK